MCSCTVSSDRKKAWPSINRSILGEADGPIVLNYTSVVDPDPYVFGPPRSGSGSFYHHAKIVRKTLIPTIL